MNFNTPICPFIHIIQRQFLYTKSNIIFWMVYSPFPPLTSSSIRPQQTGLIPENHCYGRRRWRIFSPLMSVERSYWNLRRRYRNTSIFSTAWTNQCDSDDKIGRKISPSIPYIFWFRVKSRIDCIIDYSFYYYNFDLVAIENRKIIVVRICKLLRYLIDRHKTYELCYVNSWFHC